jgi:hypothetical protein
MVLLEVARKSARKTATAGDRFLVLISYRRGLAACNRWPPQHQNSTKSTTRSAALPPNRLVCVLRRISALLLLLLFGLSLLSPLVGSDENTNLPTCCRRGGKHRCSMDDRTGSGGSGPAFRANRRCPSYPGFGTGTTTAISGLTPAASSAFSLAAESASGNAFELRILSSLRLRAHPKRGPPLTA